MSRPDSMLLDPDVLARLAQVPPRPRHHVEGSLSGVHTSAHHGSGVEFMDHEDYAPGDEIRHIDWKVFARTDQYYVRRHESETNLRATFIVDASGSMAYEGAKARASKYTYAAMMAAHLAYLLLAQQDAIGLVVVSEEERVFLPHRARSAYLMDFCRALETTAPEGRTALHKGLVRLAETGRRRGLVFVLSDLFVDLEPVARLLRQLRSWRHEVVLFHVLDDDELTFPFEHLAMFRAMESDARLLVEPRAVRSDYMTALNGFLAKVSKMCRRAGVLHQLVNTSDPVGETLLSHLGKRNGPGDMWGRHAL